MLKIFSSVFIDRFMLDMFVFPLILLVWTIKSFLFNYIITISSGAPNLTRYVVMHRVFIHFYVTIYKFTDSRRNPGISRLTNVAAMCNHCDLLLQKKYAVSFISVLLQNEADTLTLVFKNLNSVEYKTYHCNNYL